jgi:hypothetical protein
MVLLRPSLAYQVVWCVGVGSLIQALFGLVLWTQHIAHRKKIPTLFPWPPLGSGLLGTSSQQLLKRGQGVCARYMCQVMTSAKAGAKRHCKEESRWTERAAKQCKPLGLPQETHHKFHADATSVFLCIQNQKQVANLEPSNIQATKTQGDVEPRSQRACPSGEQGSQAGTCEYLRSLHQHEMGWHQSSWVVSLTPPTGFLIAPKAVHLH